MSFRFRPGISFLQVLSKDVKTPRCYLFTESYMKTLTGRSEFIDEGGFRKSNSLLKYRAGWNLFFRFVSDLGFIHSLR